MTGRRIVWWIVVFLVGLLPAHMAMGAEEYVVGILNMSAAHSPAAEGFMAALTDLASHDADATITYIYSGPVGSIGGLAAEADRLVAAGIDLLFALSTPGVSAAKTATAASQVPVVFSVVSDPVSPGIVVSLVEPGGNITGVKVGGSMGKQLEWLLTLAPDVQTVFVPHNPLDGGSIGGMAELVPAAEALGLELLIQEVTTVDELLAALGAIPEEAEALLINSSGFLTSQIAAYVAAGLALNLPVTSVCTCTDAGVLFSYGHDYWRDGEQAARLAHQILHGVPAADIPVETADFYFGVNLSTADAIGLYITDEVLDQADYIAR